MLADVTFLQKVEMLAAEVTLHFFDILKVETAAIAPHDAPAQRIVQDSGVAFEVEVKDALDSESFRAMRTDEADQMRAVDLLVIFERVLGVEDLRTEAASSVRNVELKFVFYPLQPLLSPMPTDIFPPFPAIVRLYWAEVGI